MRVLHVLDHSLPLHSGYVFRTQGALMEQRALGIETFHVTGGKHPPTDAGCESVDGFDFYRTRLNPSPMDRVPGMDQVRVVTSLRKRLDSLIGEIRPDIIHAHSPCLNGLAALRAARRHGIPVVYEMRSSWEDAAASRGATQVGSIRYRLSRRLETRVLRRVDHLITISQGLKDEAILRGVPRERISLVPNAVDRSVLEARPRSQMYRSLLESTSGRQVVGFFGSFHKYEGLDLLLEAVSQLVKRHPQLLVLLLGSGREDAALKRQAKALGLDEHVIFVGRVPHEEIPAFYQVVDIFVFPRRSMRLTEMVTPLKPLEAMAKGALVLASDIGGHRELICNGKTGILFPAGNADALAANLGQVLDEPELFSIIRKEGMQWTLSERTWTAVGRRYLPVYDGLR